ncbi:helix-turn-helix transcriptional regulator [Ruminococcus sp. NK3A76]|uniref:helix-turn-helix domain-containing protein n=1 Tax=Ruminococcus sp. NK3A76 TaxID=877411 RepID=UPI000566BE10|nr:helix-turn-helix transcriptional regulator [Ruminococcus sp. NK3A76]
MSGKIVITLDDFRKSKGVSKYKICRACNLQQTQLNAYCNNKMSRIDLDVLTRICDYLECDLTDILKYYPPEKEKNKDER